MIYDVTHAYTPATSVFWTGTHSYVREAARVRVNAVLQMEEGVVQTGRYGQRMLLTRLAPEDHDAPAGCTCAAADARQHEQQQPVVDQDKRRWVLHLADAATGDMKAMCRFEARPISDAEMGGALSWATSPEGPLFKGWLVTVRAREATGMKHEHEHASHAVCGVSGRAPFPAACALACIFLPRSILARPCASCASLVAEALKDKLGYAVVRCSTL